MPLEKLPAKTLPANKGTRGKKSFLPLIKEVKVALRYVEAHHVRLLIQWLRLAGTIDELFLSENLSFFFS
jgi:hypothetical protein